MTNYEDDFVSVDIINNEENLEYYVTIKGEKIPCSREVYLTIKRPGRKEAMRKYRDQRPFVNGHRCQDDCETCPYFVKGYGCTNHGEVSLEQLYEDGEYEPEAPGSMADDVIVRMTIEAMYKELESEDDRCRDIFNLMVQETPQRKIATELGIADGTVTYYIKKIRKKLEKFR